MVTVYTVYSRLTVNGATNKVIEVLCLMEMLRLVSQRKRRIFSRVQDILVKSRKQFETDAVIERFDEIMDFVEQTLVLWDVEKNWIEKMCLLVDEAVMNIIRYAYPRHTTGRIHLSLIHTDLALQVDIFDYGVPFDPTMHPNPDTTSPLDERPVGGLGIHFMRKMLDVFQYRREGDTNHLTLKLNLRRGDSAFASMRRIDDGANPVRVLMAVGDRKVRQALLNHLDNERFILVQADTPERLEKVVESETGIELVLLEEGLAEGDVLEIVRRIKKRQQVACVYAILLSDRENQESCIDNSAIDDYLPRVFSSSLLNQRLNIAARVLGYEKRLLEQRESHHAALENMWAWQNNVVSELSEASEYIKTLLPPEQDTPLRIRWRFSPRSFLGGDLFGCHWLDEEHLLLYVLDACGHGFRAALFAVAVQNLLLSRVVPELDWRDPAMILSRLNNAFPMERFRRMYFSMWVGIYHRHDRALCFSSGGHPPAVLVNSTASAEPPTLLTTGSMALGCMPDARYDSREIKVDEGAQLYVYTDGLIGNSKEDGSSLTRTDLTNLLMQQAGGEGVDDLLNRICRELYKGRMEDDFCLVSVQF
jgi:serine phosphatase RsbU (regulator of sigma subunit)/anti-sigma regulatory factor (Ser/Thr protein kinase)